ncbi:MAG: class I SAM-dependent methyltransferase [Actinomycetota bacterium]
MTEPPIVLFLSTGRCGTQWLVRSLRKVYDGVAVVMHEPLQSRYRSREFFRRFDATRDLANDQVVRNHLSKVAELSAERPYVETGWPMYGAIPTFIETFGGRVKVVHLTRHPVPTSLSVMSTVYDWGADGWNDIDWQRLDLLDPSCPGATLASYAASWGQMSPYAQCLYWWTEIQLHGFELEQRYVDVPMLRVRAEDLLGSDSEPLSELVEYLHLPLREELLSRRRDRIDAYGVQVPFPVEHGEIHSYPSTVEVAERLGYDVSDVDRYRHRARGSMDVREAFRLLRKAISSKPTTRAPQRTVGDDAMTSDEQMDGTQARADEAAPANRARFGEALAAHRESVDQILESGDDAAIKRLYVELGDLLEGAYSGEGDIPVLSFPETAPVVARLMRGSSGRILDAGCGPNPALTILLGRDPGRTMVAMDIGHGTVRLARLAAKREGVRMLGVVADVEALPFRDEVFSGAVCEDTIEHVPNDRQAVAELARVMLPGTRMVLGTPNRRRLDVLHRRAKDLRAGKRLPGTYYYAATSHLREYTWRSLAAISRKHFNVSARATTGWAGGPRAQLASRLVQRWPFREFGRMLFLILERR